MNREDEKCASWDFFNIANENVGMLVYLVRGNGKLRAMSRRKPLIGECPNERRAFLACYGS